MPDPNHNVFNIRPGNVNFVSILGQAHARGMSDVRIATVDGETCTCHIDHVASDCIAVHDAEGNCGLIRVDAIIGVTFPC